MVSPPCTGWLVGLSTRLESALTKEFQIPKTDPRTSPYSYTDLSSPPCKCFVSSPWIIAVVCERERSNAKLVIHPEHGEGGADGMAGLHGDHSGDLARLVDGHQIWVSKDLGNVEIKVSPLAVVASCRCLL